MIGRRRRTFPTAIELADGSTFETLDGATAFKVAAGEKAASTQAELDRMLFDMVKRWCTPAPDPEPNHASVPTDAELRDQARELGACPHRHARERPSGSAKTCCGCCADGSDRHYGEAIAAWTAHYEADTAKALERIEQMRQHGIPEAHRAELLGASLALTPRENRCIHWGDKTNCVHCLTDLEDQ